MAPVLAHWPSLILMPSRLLSDSRPNAVEPAAFLCAIKVFLRFNLDKYNKQAKNCQLGRLNGLDGYLTLILDIKNSFIFPSLWYNDNKFIIL